MLIPPLPTLRLMTLFLPINVSSLNLPPVLPVNDTPVMPVQERLVETEQALPPLLNSTTEVTTEATTEPTVEKPAIEKKVPVIDKVPPTAPDLSDIQGELGDWQERLDISN
jgi:hypothetical protein